MSKEQIPQRLKEARKQLQLNQIQIAMDLDIQQKSISDIENGKIINIPNTYIYYFYNKGVSLDWIYDGKGTMLINESKEKENTQKIEPDNSLFQDIRKLDANIKALDKTEISNKNLPDKNSDLFERLIESKEFTISSLLAYIKSQENNLDYLKDLLDKTLKSKILTDK